MFSFYTFLIKTWTLYKYFDKSKHFVVNIIMPENWWQKKGGVVFFLLCPLYSYIGLLARRYKININKRNIFITYLSADIISVVRGKGSWGGEGRGAEREEGGIWYIRSGLLLLVTILYLQEVNHKWEKLPSTKCWNGEK